MNTANIPRLGKTYQFDNIYVSSDWHIGHHNIIKLCNRPFLTCDEMDLTIKTNCKGGNNDALFYCGDWANWKNPEKYRELVTNALDTIGYKKIFCVFGNHDLQRDWLSTAANLTVVQDLIECEINGKYHVFFHYPIDNWNKKHHGAIHYYGHVHDKNAPQIENRINACLEVNNYKPIKIA